MAQPPIRGRASPSSKQEIERMEQQRLAQPCMRNIDLRPLAVGKCREIRNGGRVHWLDEYGEAVFEVMMKKYKGQYTLGVYEKVLNTRPERPPGAMEQTDQPETVSSLHDPSVMLIDFGYRPRRTESRLNYVSGVTMELENGNKVAGKTLDLSLAGVRVSPSSMMELAPGTPLAVSFEDLQQKHPEPLGEIAYTVVATDKEPDRYIYRLKRQMRDSEEEFNQFIPHFIESQSSRYKHELKDLLPVVYARSYDRLYGQRAQCLYAYFRENQGRLELDCVAGPIENALIEETPLIAFAARQLPKIFSAAQLPTDTMSVTQANALHVIRWQSHIFAIPTEALEIDAQKNDWLRLWNEAQEVANYALIWRKQEAPHAAVSEEVLELLPESLHEHGQHWRERLKKVAYACTLIPFASMLRPAQTFEALATQIPDWLKPWEVSRAQFPLLIGMGVRAQRVQDRYLHKTNIIIEGDKETVTGDVIDFSVNGLRIELHSRCCFVSREIVRVSFSALQEKINEPEQLALQPYRVVRIMQGGLFVTLERDFRVFQHGAARFFTQIIHNNRHRLPRCTLEQQQIADARLAELWVGTGLNGVPFFIMRDEEKKPSVFACGHNPSNSLLTLKVASVDISITSLNVREFLVSLLSEQCNNVGVVDKVRHCLVQVSVNNGETDWLIIDTETVEKTRRSVARAFAKKARIFACSLSPINALPRRELEHLLRPVFNNSRYRADQFRIELTRIVGVGSLFDITQVLEREGRLLSRS